MAIPKEQSMVKVNRYLARNRVLIALAIILTAAFIGTSLVNYSLTRKAIHEEILQKDLPLTRDNIYSDIISEVMKPILVASSMASDTFLIDWAMEGEQEVDKVKRYLRKIRDRYDFFSTFFISDQSLTYYHYKGIHKTISPDDSHDAWYYRFIKNEREYELDVDTDEASQNVLTVFINYKVFDSNGTLLGVTGVGIQIDTLAKLIGDYQDKYDRSIFLTNMAGDIQVHQDQSYIENRSITQLSGIAPLAGQILALGDEPADFQFEREGEDILLTVRYIEPLDWLLYVEQNETSALALARRNLIRTILIGLGVSVVVILLALFTINRYQARIEEMATLDALTGIANRRVLEHEYMRALYGSNRSGKPFSIILMDLDGFKEVNDKLGHLAGDLVLKQVADVVSMTVRPIDTVARWGGDEFVVLTELGGNEAAKIAERIRLSISQTEMTEPGSAADDPRKKITICCGVAQHTPGDSLDDLIGRADRAMYQCKEMGGNDVVVDNL